jgi:peroxiredoxin Q/BCP
MAIEEGKKAPAFTLPDENSDKVKLSGLAGQWVVLYFYPRADTPGCTIQACAVTSGIQGFEKFIKKHKLKIHLLSDPSHRVMEKYAAWGEKNMYGKITEGVIRSTVLIDPAGRVAKHWKRVKTKGHAEAVSQVLKQLQSNYPLDQRAKTRGF